MILKGVYAPIITPFNADESINYPVLDQLIEYLIGNRIAGLVPGGTTGRSMPSLSRNGWIFSNLSKRRSTGGSH